MKQPEVVALMESSKTENEWNANCDKVKATCGGYPDFWYEAVVRSGLAGHVAARFGKSADITMTAKTSRPLPLYSRPGTMPSLRPGEQVVGIYDQGLGEKELPCDSLEDMQRLYDSYASGMALKLRWVIVATSDTVLPA